MHFQISKTIDPGRSTLRREDDIFEWALTLADGEVVARGPDTFDDEVACRSQIARAKKSMKGALRCKVLSPE